MVAGWLVLASGMARSTNSRILNNGATVIFPSMRIARLIIAVLSVLVAGTIIFSWQIRAGAPVGGIAPGNRFYPSWRIGSRRPNLPMAYTMLAIAGLAVGGIAARKFMRRVHGEITESGAHVYELSSYVFLLDRGPDYVDDLAEGIRSSNFVDSSGRSLAVMTLANIIQEGDIVQCNRKRILRSESPEALMRSSKRLFDLLAHAAQALTGGTRELDGHADSRAVQSDSVCLLGIVAIAPAFNTTSDPNNPAAVHADLDETSDLMNDEASFLYYWHAPSPGQYLSPAQGEQLYFSAKLAAEEFEQSGVHAHTTS